MAVIKRDHAGADDGDPRPIGVFDSGIGGLTVVSALRKLLPNESIYYLGDTARVPYGGRSASTVQRYSQEIAALLLGENAKTIVVACNTASAVALPALEARLPVTVTGVIAPGAAAAIASTRNGHIGVIGTRATIRSGAYEQALRRLSPEVQVTARACPLLVPLIEEGRLVSPITDAVLMEYLQPLLDDGIDTLVLGCTHYPLLRAAIARLLGDSVTLVDSAENCAHAVRDLLGIGQLRIVRCGNAIDHEQADSRRILHPDSLSIEHLLLAQGKTKLQDHGFL